MAEHSHTHEVMTECGDECGRQHHEKFTHVHEDGHVLHQHRIDGVKLLKGTDGDILEEIEEKEDKKEALPVRKPGNIW